MSGVQRWVDGWSIVYCVITHMAWDMDTVSSSPVTIRGCGVSWRTWPDTWPPSKSQSQSACGVQNRLAWIISPCWSSLVLRHRRSHMARASVCPLWPCNCPAHPPLARTGPSAVCIVTSDGQTQFITPRYHPIGALIVFEWSLMWPVALGPVALHTPQTLPTAPSNMAA